MKTKKTARTSDWKSESKSAGARPSNLPWPKKTCTYMSFDNACRSSLRVLRTNELSDPCSGKE